MQFSTSALIRLLQFFEQTEKETYPETPMDVHTEITEMAIKHLHELYPLQEGVKILDVGCGQGPALRHFRDAGAQATGITLNQIDVDVCREKGFEVYPMDQSFMEFEPESFDIIWARHVIEHSVMPLFTLREFNRVLKKGGMLYLEVPGADTDAGHACNANHYSVFTRQSWFSLLAKSGFEIIDGQEYRIILENDAGCDYYWGYYCRCAEHGVRLDESLFHRQKAEMLAQFLRR